ncbi:PhzF family phenazine biosynthesis protein [bacterium]|nr:MAG: PhzF family phenazine biosynthesis protein [bacterium]
MPVPIALVDAFAERPFTGNPAGVVILDGPTLGDPTMQEIALEMNQAETAFTYPQEDGTWSLRWFTPSVEVDLCGHATLATAHRLWETDAVTEPMIAFSTRSGRLTAERINAGIRLDFPAEPPLAADPPLNAVEILGATPLWWGRNRMDHFAVVRPEALEGDWTPRMAAIAAMGMRGLIVTAIGDHGRDFVSRCFFPQSGVPEDPVTGSAHCALAPYWGSRLGQTELIGYQASPRGGTVACALRGDRVLLTGRAITTVTGALTTVD